MTTTHLILRNVHISAGLLTLVTGAAAMTFRKGSPMHRRAGNAFFVSMLILAALGVLLALAPTPNMGTIMGGTTAFYMVATAWATVIRREGAIGRFEIVAAVAGSVITAGAMSLGIQALLSSNGRVYGYPALMYFIFGSILLLATALDWRMIARGGLTGTARTTRHLWRMSLAFFMATGSFFFGQPKFVPEVLRDTGLYIVAGLLPVGLMIYWLIRVRVVPLIKKDRAPRLVQTT